MRGGRRAFLSGARRCLALLVWLLVVPAPTLAQAVPAADPQPSLRDIIGPMPAIAATPFFGLTVLSALGLVTRLDIVQHSDLPIVRSLRQNALVHQAERHSSPGVFAALAALTLIGWAANSGKLQGLVGKLFRMAEDLVTALAYSLLGLSAVAAAGGTEPAVALAAVTGSSILFGLAILTGLGLMMATRFAFDVLIWLFPFPFVDFLFETAKKLATAGFLVLYLLAPGAALGLAVMALLVSLVLCRWAFRLVHFAFSIILRPVVASLFHHWRAGTVYEPLSGLVGPAAASCDVLTPAAVLLLKGEPARRAGALIHRDGVATFVSRGTITRRRREAPLTAPDDALVLVRTIAWLELQVVEPRGRVRSRLALPNTLLSEFDALRSALGARDGGHAGVAKILAQPEAFNRRGEARG